MRKRDVLLRAVLTASLPILYFGSFPVAILLSKSWPTTGDFLEKFYTPAIWLYDRGSLDWYLHLWLPVKYKK